MRTIAIGLLAVFTLTACVPQQGQSKYLSHEVGKATELEEARILKVREVEIKGQTGGGGASVGALAGAGAGTAVGSGNGQLAAVIVGALIGAVAGEMAEQHARDQRGYEYRVKTSKGKIKTIVQHQHKDDVVFKKGDRVLVQLSGNYQRVLPND